MHDRLPMTLGEDPEGNVRRYPDLAAFAYDGDGPTDAQLPCRLAAPEVQFVINEAAPKVSFFEAGCAAAGYIPVTPAGSMKKVSCLWFGLRKLHSA